MAKKPYLTEVWEQTALLQEITWNSSARMKKTQSSPVGGYQIAIKEAATRSSVQGTVPLTQAMIDAKEQLTFTEGGVTLTFETIAGENVETTINRLDKAIINSAMKIEIVRTPGSGTNPHAPQLLRFRHKEYGSEHSFQVASNTAGVLSSRRNTSDTINNGCLLYTSPSPRDRG